MSLDALVAEVGQALGDARGLFGPAPEAGEWASTAGLGTGRDGVRQVIGAAARDWTGVGASTYVRTSSGQVQALDSVIGADQGTSPGFAATADSSRGDGICARGPSIRSAKVVSTMACLRWVMSASVVGRSELVKNG